MVAIWNEAVHLQRAEYNGSPIELRSGRESDGLADSLQFTGYG